MQWNKEDIMRRLVEALKQNNPQQRWIKNNLLFLHVSGSRLYGINREDSDYDVRGVTIAPKEYWVGAPRFEQWEYKLPDEGLDFVIYDFRKWLKLTVDCNPNVVETLYVQYDNPNVIWEHYDWTGYRWQDLRKQILPLINKRAYAGYRGYSTAQLKKMAVKQSNKTGRRHITDEFGFDLKFASHGFRLLHQGAELLRTNNITFPRPDAQRLRDIREGRTYKPDEVDKCISDWEQEQVVLDEAYKNSILPERADYEKYNEILINVFDEYVNF